ncbi:MAG: AmmeMemoRadiSam system protein A [Desulforhopalus sp.]|nr:AmmeMemoRadiSam system protein A [Desulforhopalus sp.]
MTITVAQCQLLLRLARQAIAGKLGLGRPDAQPLRPPGEDQLFHEPAAVFVTLHLAEKLRGCIGHLEPVGPLWQSVRDNAINAAFHDSRFAPLSTEELTRVRLEISILSKPRQCSYRNPEELLDLLQPDKDGVILRSGRSGATFLPQVWQQLPDPALFLGQLCRKAGLPENTWQQGGVQILTYRVESCREENR